MKLEISTLKLEYQSRDLDFKSRDLEFQSRDLEFQGRDLEFKDYYGMALIELPTYAPLLCYLLVYLVSINCDSNSVST